MVAAVTLPLAAFFVFGMGPESEGTLRVSGPNGDFTVEGAECARGAEDYDVALGRREAGRALLVRAESGATRVLIAPPGCAGLDCARALERDDCERFEALVRDGDHLANRYPVLDGHLRLRCASAADSSVEGSITFQGCE
ncbi:MAG TPA: hypothetical protein RMH99_20695 [Sandaracinaceae bacterium LLY-WYZ-13_1]|nr:hypothetical protein [Sandaracinaceae bacterium LLY-WYZ-13_1]